MSRVVLAGRLCAGLSILLGPGCAQLLDVDHQYELGPSPEGDARVEFPDAAPVVDAQSNLPDAAADAGVDAASEGGVRGGQGAGDAASPPDGAVFDGSILEDDAGEAVDAGTGKGDDAGRDASLDAGPDAGADSGAGFCARAGTHLVCDDFDQDPPQFWSETNVLGSQQLDSTTFTSPPNAYVASTATLDGSSPAKVTSQRVFSPPGVSGYHFETSLRIDQRDMVSAPALGTVEIKNSQTGWYYSSTLVLDGTGAVFEDIHRTSSGAPSIHQRRSLPRTIPDATWVRVVVDVNFDGTSGTVTLHLDGDLMLDRVPLQVGLAEGSEVNLFIGINYLSGPAPPWTVRFDDVVFDLK